MVVVVVVVGVVLSAYPMVPMLLVVRLALRAVRLPPLLSPSPHESIPRRTSTQSSWPSTAAIPTHTPVPLIPTTTLMLAMRTWRERSIGTLLEIASKDQTPPPPVPDSPSSFCARCSCETASIESAMPWIVVGHMDTTADK